MNSNQSLESYDTTPDRRRIYGLPAVPVDIDAKLTAETRRQADNLFSLLIEPRLPKGRKLAAKRSYFQILFHALKRAMYARGTVRISRAMHSPTWSKANMQVIDAATRCGLVTEVRSPRGSPKMSRLVPMPALHAYAASDPWSFDPADSKRQFVFLRKWSKAEDGTKRRVELPLPDSAVLLEAQQRLELVNKVNAEYAITYRPWDELNQDFCERRQLRPVHYAIFDENLEHHDRIYTGKYGHQELQRVERETIEVNGEPTVEHDYAGHHARLLYHLDGLEYTADPYALWGPSTTPAHRLLAKTLVNAALNARTEQAALSACYDKMRRFRERADGRGIRVRKEGKALRTAEAISAALKQTGLTFKTIYPIMLAYHAPIRQHFSCIDTGRRLMRHDSEIALEVLFHFAKMGVMCLACHDSFVVPRHSGLQLLEAMRGIYYECIGRLPQVKDGTGQRAVTGECRPTCR